MEISGYFAAILIGVSLGLIGGGGSILTVPVLVYLLGVNPVMATAYSLFIVGSTSLVGAYSKFRKGTVNLQTALIFGLPSIAAVFFTRKYLVPAIPDEIFLIGALTFTKSFLLMLLFAEMMVFAAFSMIRNKKHEPDGDLELKLKFNYPVIIVEGVIVGFLTGLVGAGGGFLIIPALVLLSRLPMKMAVGTSLLIIAAKSLIGFMGDMANYQMDWKLLMMMTALSIGGIFLGNYFCNKIDGLKLKRMFGWFVLLMGFYIIIKELFLN
ncbi:MAG: sulfite exporter TauE/SafE family protein [Bacteroidetes bacterium]|nr:sulfite exporter TauE/SafE family protein [Bacteroidota bacterium]